MPRSQRDWEVIQHHTSWESPPYGLSADEWPAVPGHEKPQAFSKLRLVASDGEIVERDGPRVIRVLRP